MLGDNLVPSVSWKQGEFREICAEALAEFDWFQQHLSATLRGCNGGTDLSAIQESFTLADARYRKTVELVAQLSLRFGKKVKGRKLTDWTPQEVADNALVRALQGLVSTTMNHLLGAYRPWLAKAQFTEGAEC
jgi:hypothetical protein